MEGDEMLIISPADVQEQLESGAARFALVDCRERMELGVGVLPGAAVIPMSEFQARVSELDRDRPVVVYCAHGVRSLNVAAYLNNLGYQAKSMAGGFAAWAGPKEKWEG